MHRLVKYLAPKQQLYDCVDAHFEIFLIQQDDAGLWTRWKPVGTRRLLLVKKVVVGKLADEEVVGQ